jgi:TetR/AcrR family transcriptional repressor of nem operon
MGRKCAFDKEKAIQGALGAFWRDGYDKTSLEDLLSSMGIKTSSFYHSFESKESLFFEVLQHYRQSLGRERLNFLTAEDVPGREALLKYFEHLVTRNNKGMPSGCFMMKTAANLTDPNSTVGKEVSISISNVEKGFQKALLRGISEKQIRKDINVEDSAQLLLAVAYGLSVLSRTKKSKKDLLSTAHALIDMLTSKS